MIAAIIVTYNPERSLEALVVAMEAESDAVIVVDNASACTEFIRDLESKYQITCIYNRDNVGLAAALNQGVQAAVQGGADYICLLDQDSQPADRMITTLLAELLELQQVDAKTVAIAPRLCDIQSGKSIAFVSDSLLGKRFMPTDDARAPVALSHAITSGTVMPVKSVHDVGMMWEALFIDYIDVEWCYRARSLGGKIYGSSRAVLHHDIGERRIKFPCSDRQIPVHVPTRHFYLFRNLLWLSRRPEFNSRWCVKECARLLIKLFVELVFAPQRCLRIRYVVRGIVAGIRRAPPHAGH